LLFFATPVLTDLVVPGFNATQRQLTIQLTRIMILSPVFFTGGVIASVLLQSYNRFLATSLAPILYNLGIIFGATVLYKWMGPTGLACGVILGALMHMVIQLWDMRKLPIKLNLSFNTNLKSVREVWKMYLPRLFFFDISQISLLISSIIGSYLAAGSISIFSQASNLQAVPLGIFAISFAVAAFPGLSKSWADNNIDYFKKLLSTTTVQILFFIVPLSALMIILRAQIVRIFLVHGQRLGWQEIILTAQTLGILSIALIAQSLTALLSRGFYATHNTVSPVIVSVFTAIVNILLAILLSKHWGVLGLAAATTISSVLNFTLLAVLSRLKMGKVFEFAVLESSLKIFIAAVFAASSAYATLYAVSPVINTSTILGLIIQTLCATGFGLVVYLIIGLLLNLHEARSFVRTLQLWLSKLARPLSAVAISFESK
jgi:putative peptidoglycan lipid II flippase